ncbi:hypothetical protein AB205_0166770 [Aquarana catesbeiana]|uniref:Uncharacterized protein n=1 Tax=Aquarana catesbeiana TaxID=8400 RepID=A0A2G9Q7L5_AQUCT|nr:hypothetical protein AB205_0166770 [Aquarana catesbeiana]
MSSTERSGECCKKVSSCPVFLFFMFLTFVLLHVLFLQVYIFKWQISCSWVHYSFVSNIFLSAYKTPLFRPYALGHNFYALFVRNYFGWVDGFVTRMKCKLDSV